MAIDTNLWCVDYEARAVGALGIFSRLRVFVQAKTKKEAGKNALAKIHKYYYVTNISKIYNIETRLPIDIIPQKDFKRQGIHYYGKTFMNLK